MDMKESLYYAAAEMSVTNLHSQTVPLVTSMMGSRVTLFSPERVCTLNTIIIFPPPTACTQSQSRLSAVKCALLVLWSDEGRGYRINCFRPLTQPCLVCAEC